MPRLETGTLKLEGDWAGYFLRGDDALRLSQLISSYIKTGNMTYEWELMKWAKRLMKVEQKEGEK
jgi:hypothetical protein